MDMSRTWGALCPEDSGLLVEMPEWAAKGVLWCANNDMHGGNGRFWRYAEVKEGWYDPTRPPEPTEALKEIQARQAARTAAFEADRERYNKDRQDKERRHMADTKTAKATTPKAGKEPRECLCGCGGMTKGGRFIPGHDARFHARVKTLINEPLSLSHDEAEKIASQGPLTGKYAVKPAAKATNGTGKAADVATSAVTAVPKPAPRGKGKGKQTRAAEPENTPAAGEIEV